MSHIQILQLRPNLHAIATAARLVSSLTHSKPKSHKQILSYATNSGASSVTFTPAWSQIPVTNLITHLPSYLVGLSRWGGGVSRKAKGGRQVHRECEGILTKCNGLRPCLASSQLALGHDTGATLDHHPDLSTLHPPNISLSS